MKWTDVQVEKLKELCYAGKSNTEIAGALNCKLSDVYSKRSQLGITIDKCKGVPLKPKAGLNKQVKATFSKLHDELLVTIAKDGIPEDRAKKYSALYQELLDLEEKYDKLLKIAGCC